MEPKSTSIASAYSYDSSQPRRMRFEIVVAPHPSSPEGPPLPPSGPSARATPSPRPRAPPRARGARRLRRRSERHRARPRDARRLRAARPRARARRPRATPLRESRPSRFYDEPWELCVERFGAAACLSVYRTGPDPVVAVYDRAVPFDEVVAAARAAIERVLRREGAAQPACRRRPGGATPGARVGARAALRDRAVAESTTKSACPSACAVVVEPDRDAPLSFGAEFAIRERTRRTGEAAERVRLERPRPSSARTCTRCSSAAGCAPRSAGRPIDLGECHPVLVAERLVELARRAFDAWERGLALNARADASGLAHRRPRLSPDGELALTLGAAHGVARRTVHTFPALGVADVLEAALAFGRSLVRAILRRDRSQSANLRLGALRRTAARVDRGAPPGEPVRLQGQPDPRAIPRVRRRARRGRRARPVAARSLAVVLEPRRRPPPVRRALARDRARDRSPRDLPLRRPGDRRRGHGDVGARPHRAAASCGARTRPAGTSVVTPGGIARLAPDGTALGARLRDRGAHASNAHRAARRRPGRGRGRPPARRCRASSSSPRASTTSSPSI